MNEVVFVAVDHLRQNRTSVPTGMYSGPVNCRLDDLPVRLRPTAP